MFNGNRLPSEGPSEPTSPQFTALQPSTQPWSKRNREKDMDDAIIHYLKESKSKEDSSGKEKAA